MINKYLLFLLFPLSILAQDNSQGEEAFQRLTQHFHSYVDKSELAGTVIFLEQNGVLKKDCYGFQDVASKKPITENSIFRWASMTKPIVATAVMQLVEQGKISLGDPVAHYIPQVGKMMVYSDKEPGTKAKNTMTVRQLLSHTSGSTSRLDFRPAGQAAAKFLAKQEINNLEELVDAISRTQLAFEPGEGWAYGYSNDLLAYIVEQVSGKSIDNYLQDNILGPLEMNNTAFQVKAVDHLTSIYAPDDKGQLKVIEAAENSKYVNGKNFPRGNGGLAGTAKDYLHFCQMILHQGKYKGREILQSESVSMMLKNVLPEKVLPMKVANMEMIGQGYGLGFGVVMENSLFGTIGDIYWPGALYTYFFISPEHQAIGLFMTQLFDPTRMSLIWEFHGLATEALIRG